MWSFGRVVLFGDGKVLTVDHAHVEKVDIGRCFFFGVWCESMKSLLQDAEINSIVLSSS